MLVVEKVWPVFVQRQSTNNVNNKKTYIVIKKKASTEVPIAKDLIC